MEAKKENDERISKEKKIMTTRSSKDQEEIFKDILEKTIYEKARDKMLMGKKKEEEDTSKEQVKDYLAPILEKFNYLDMELQEDQALEVKNEALKRLKERLLTRADIIQRRLETETKELENAFANLKRKGEAASQEDELEYEKKVSATNFKIEVRCKSEANLFSADLDGARESALQELPAKVRRTRQEAHGGPSPEGSKQEESRPKITFLFTQTLKKRCFRNMDLENIEYLLYL